MAIVRLHGALHIVLIVAALLAAWTSANIGAESVAYKHPHDGREGGHGAPYTADDTFVAELLAGSAVTVDEFFSEYFEQRELIVRGANSSALAGLFPLSRLAALLHTPGMRYGMDVKVLRAGSAVLSEVDEPVTAAAVAAAFAGGATVAINRLHERDSAVRALASRAERAFVSFANCNLYLTPPDAVGLDVHFDIRDVFVLQIEGAKTWRVWPPQDELPVDKAEVREPAVTLAPARAREFTLYAGDLLYMPRGVLHQPRTPADSHSLHVTLGVEPIRVEDALSLAMNAVLGAERTSERVYGPGASGDGAATTFGALFTALLRQAADEDVALRRGLLLGRLAALARGQESAAALEAELARVRALFDGMVRAFVKRLASVRLRDLAALQQWTAPARLLRTQRYAELVAELGTEISLDSALAELERAVVRAATVEPESAVFASISCARAPSCLAAAWLSARVALSRIESGTRTLWVAGRAEPVRLPSSACVALAAALRSEVGRNWSPAERAQVLPDASARAACELLLINLGFAEVRAGPTRTAHAKPEL